MLFRDETAAGAARPAEGRPERLGDFRIERELGRGGMGIVYLATQESIRRKVAVKVLPLGAAPMLDAVERFHREASVVARLQHEGIVPIYAMGQEQGCLYYAMEYIDGDALRDRILRGPLAPREAAEIARDTARALHHAHEAGVVHRDVKPGNILIDARGKARLADFGLARAAGSQTLTIPGTVLGTPAYMSPEQACGARDLDARSDVYALGAVLYEALAGRPPVDPKAPILDQLANVQFEEPPSVARVNARVPRDLDVIVGHAMAKPRDRRYGSAAALADDLDRWLRGEAIQARPPSLGFRAMRLVRRHRAAVAAGAFAALLLAAAAVYAFTRPGRLTLDVQPPDARVWIDGAPAASVNRLRLAAGPHRLRIEREGYAPVDLTYTLGRGEGATLPVNLRRLQQRVTVLTDPPDCRLTLVGRGGERVRHLSPLEGELIDTDAYELVVERDGYYRRRIPVEVTPDRPVVERVYLPRAVLWTAKEDQRSRFVTCRVGADDEVAVAAAVESGHVVFLRGRDGEVLGRIPTGDDFPSPAVVDADLDGISELLVLGYHRSKRLLRWPSGQEIWSEPPALARGRTLLVEGAPGEGPEIWECDATGIEAFDLLTRRSKWRVSAAWEEAAAWIFLGREATGIARYAVCFPDSILAYRFPAEEVGRLAIRTFDRDCVVKRTDLDSDGLLDFAVSYSDGVIRAYRAEPLSLLWETEPTGDRYCTFAVGALRPGERPSVVAVAGERVRVWDADGRDRGGRSAPGPTTAWPYLADMDADGDRDLVYATSDTVWVLDLFSERTLAEVPGVADAGYGAITDLDDDGLLDMVYSTVGGGIVAIPGPKVAWEHRAQHAIRQPPALRDVSGNGNPDVVCTSLDFFVHALEGGTGRLLWKVSMENQAATTPAFVGSDVIAAAWGGRARRIRGATGEVLWTYQPPGEEGWAVNFHASPATADIDGDGRWEVLLADWQTAREESDRERGAVHCLDAGTGRPRWVRVVGAAFAAAPVVLPAGRVLVGDTQGRLACLSAADGSVRWQSDVGGEFRAEASWAPAELEDDPFVVWPCGRTILRVDGDGAREIELGRGRSGIAWARGGEPWIAVTTGPDDARGIDWTSGRELWRWESPEPLGSPVAADLDADGATEVVVVDRAGEVTVLRAATGERVWRFGVGAEVQAAPRIADVDGDGAPEIVLAALDGRVVVIRGRGRRWSGEWSAALGDLRGSGAPDSVGP